MSEKPDRPEDPAIAQAIRLAAQLFLVCVALPFLIWLASRFWATTAHPLTITAAGLMTGALVLAWLAAIWILAADKPAGPK